MVYTIAMNLLRTALDGLNVSENLKLKGKQQFILMKSSHYNIAAECADECHVDIFVRNQIYGGAEWLCASVMNMFERFFLFYCSQAEM